MTVSSFQRIRVPDVTSHEADESAHDGTYGRLYKASDLPSSAFYVGHRGTPINSPEHTAESYRLAIAHGATALKVDLYQLADGSFGVMHDATVDRTTSSSGSTGGFVGSRFQSLTVDAPTYMNAAGLVNTKPLLLTDVLNEFGGQVVLFLDVKSGSRAKVYAEVARRGLLSTVVLWCTDTLGVVTSALDAGFTDLLFSWNTTTIASVTPAAVIAAGVNRVSIGFGYTDADIQAVYDAAAGITTRMAHTTTRRWQRDRMAALGATAFLTDDPLYTAAAAALMTADKWAQLVPMPGSISATIPSSSLPYHIPILGAGRLSATTAATNTGQLLGFLCPVAAPTAFTLSATITFDALDADTTRHAGILVGAPDDLAFAFDSKTNGYNCLLGENGDMRIFKQVRGAITNGVVASGTSQQIGSTTSSAAISAAQAVPVTIQVTPTQIIFTRTDTGASVTVSDSTYRGGYIHFGKNGAGLQVSLSNVSVA